MQTTGLPSYTMGNWLTPNGITYSSWPSNRGAIHKIPRTPSIPTTKQKNNGSGGVLVNGVYVWQNGDGQSYNTSTGITNTAGGSGVWNRLAGVAEAFNFDPANGHQPTSGAYHNHINPLALRYQLGDNVTYNSSTKAYAEGSTPTAHSPIIGWANDGLPIYGPYGYSSALDATSGIRRMTSGFVKRNSTNAALYGTDDLASTGRVKLPVWAASVQGISQTLASTSYGPSTSTTYSVGGGVTATYSVGVFAEDYEYLGDLGKTQGTDFDLNCQNVRYCVTPDFPSGTYAYFTCIDSSGSSVFPDVINQEYFGSVSGNGTVTSITGAVTEYTDAGPAAAITVAATTSGSGVLLSWNSAEGATYKVESSSDNSSFTVLSSSVTSAGLTTTYTASAAANYFRVTLTALSTYDSNGTYGTPVGKTATASYTISAPAITSTLTASGTYAAAISTYTITASNTPTSYSATNLPTGLAVNTSTGAITGTPTVAGTYSVTIGATNAGGTGTATLVFTISASFATWQAQKFTTVQLADSATSGATADSDLDGFSTQVEYALGLTPTSADSTGRPAISTTSSNWVYTYTRPTGLSDVTYSVEASTDLTTWSTTGVTHTNTSTVSGVETWTGSYALTTGGALFLRLKTTVGAQTSGAPPLGGLTFAIAEGSAAVPVTTSFAMPVLDTAAASGAAFGRIASATSTTLTVTNAGWTSGALALAAYPYAIRLTSGSAAGYTFTITANTADTVTISGSDPTNLGLTTGTSGDGFRLIPIDTLNTLFGSSTLLGGTSSSTADVVTLSGSAQFSFYYNTTLSRWVRTTGPTTDRGDTVVSLDTALSITRRSSALTLRATGAAPTERFVLLVANAGSTYTHAGFPADVTLGTLALQTALAGWVSATSASSADTLSVLSGAGYLSYFYNGTNWQRTTGPATNRDAITISAGTPILLYKRGSASGTAVLQRSLPYTL